MLLGSCPLWVPQLARSRGMSEGSAYFACACQTRNHWWISADHLLLSFAVVCLLGDSSSVSQKMNTCLPCYMRSLKHEWNWQKIANVGCASPLSSPMIPWSTRHTPRTPMVHQSSAIFGVDPRGSEDLWAVNHLQANLSCICELSEIFVNSAPAATAPWPADQSKPQKTEVAKVVSCWSSLIWGVS